jgi:hippurate hydrolase
MKRLAVSIAAGFGAEAVVDFRNLFAPVVNNEQEAAVYADAAADVAGEANVQRNAPPAMASEDFGFMMEQVPGAHVLFGNGGGADVHNHLYDFNDEAIPYGVALLAAITRRKLPKGI